MRVQGRTHRQRICRALLFGFLFLVSIGMESEDAEALELAASGGLRNFSSQAENGKSQYHSTVGARISLLTKSAISPELTYTLTQADFAGLKVNENSIQAGVFVVPNGGSRSFRIGFMAGLSYFLTQYSGQGSSEGSQSIIGIYGGVGFIKQLGFLVVRIDASQTVHFSFKDSTFMGNLSFGVNL